MNEFVENINKIINELPYDLRAEVVTNAFIDAGIDADEIIISPKSSFTRKYHRDIEQVSLSDQDSIKEQYILVEINREGMYDALPEVLVHPQRPNKKGNKDANDMAAEVKQRRIEEKAARKFFLPFENEFYHQRVKLEGYEQAILNEFANNFADSSSLINFWKLPDFLDTRQKLIFIYLIPVINKITGNFKLIKSCYEAILNVDVSFTIEQGFEQTINHTSLPGLKEFRLGINFVCGDKFLNHIPRLKIKISLNKKQFYDFFPDQKGYKIIEFLNAYYLPFDLENDIQINLKNSVPEFRLNEKEISRLSYDTWL